MSDYQFQYLPLTGKLSGKQMIEQTEQAINELAQVVDEGSAQVEVITNLANTANDNAEEALEKAQQALDTTGRVYINETSAVDIDDYYDSQLLYIEDSTSTHLPVADSGFLDVKTNDTKTACEQLFTADTDGQLYFRSGVITASTVGDVTVYSVEYSDWASYSTSAYVQAELGNYLPLAGGTMTGDILYNGITNEVFHVGRTEDDGSRDIGWFNGNNNSGANIALRSAEFTDSGMAGEFILVAKNSSASKNLVGKPDGTLTWGGTAISLSGHTHSYLPLSGGTLTGEIKRSGVLASNTNDTTSVQLNGGTNGSNGAYIILYGKSHSSYAGRITLRTGDGTNTPALLLYPNGTATWNGNDILTDATVGSYLSKDLSSSVSLSASTAKTIISMSLPAGRWIVKGFVRYTSVTADKIYGAQLTASANTFSYVSSSGVTAHSSNTGNISVQTTHVWNQSSTANIYLCGYATAACTAENAVIQAIRIV